MSFYSSDETISLTEITPSEYADISNSKISFISLFCLTQAILKFCKISGLIVVTKRLRSTFDIQSFLSMCVMYIMIAHNTQKSSIIFIKLTKVVNNDIIKCSTFKNINSRSIITFYAIFDFLVLTDVLS